MIDLKALTEGKKARKVKPVLILRGPEIKYTADLFSVVTFMTGLVRDQLVPELKRLEPQYRTIDSAKMSQDAYNDDLTATLDAIIILVAASIRPFVMARRMAFNSANAADRRWITTVQRSFGIDISSLIKATSPVPQSFSEVESPAANNGRRGNPKSSSVAAAIGSKPYVPSSASASAAAVSQAVSPAAVQAAAGTLEVVASPVGINIAPVVSQPAMATAIDIAIEKNVALIRSIPARYFESIREIMLDGVVTGRRADDIARDIAHQTGVAYRRARIIARDQVAKTVASVHEVRMKEAGIKGYTWRTMRDERVRHSHRDLEGKRFTWRNPPSIGNPGTPVNCRCYAEPDFEAVADSV